MIDTISFFRGWEDLNFDRKYIQNKITNSKISIDSHKEIETEGFFKNFRVKTNSHGVFMTGSLTKLLLGENITTLKHQQVKDAIETLKQGLGSWVGGAKITRIDIGSTLLTKHHPAKYLTALIKAPRMKISNVSSIKSETVYFMNGQKTLVFYNKGLEAKVCQNFLRYELRFTKKLSKQLKISNFHVDSLYDSSIFNQLIDRWIEEFTKITILEKPSFSTEKYNVTTVKENLLQKGIESYGGLGECLKLIMADFKQKMIARGNKDNIVSFIKSMAANSLILLDVKEELENLIFETASQAMEQSQYEKQA